MSEPSEGPSVSNGTTDPLKRLSSFKTPRDLSLGGVKPNKKVFTPNLNVSRNKNKGPNLPIVTRDKRNDKERRDRRDKNKKNVPNIIKSSGVFSEGMGVTEMRSARSSYRGDKDSEPTPALQKPVIRVKDVWKIDKELEQRKINKVLGVDNVSDDEVSADDAVQDKDAPVKLPLSEGGWLSSKPKASLTVKHEVIVKKEPRDDMTLVDEKKPVVDVKQAPSEEMDIVSLLRSEKPALIMLQFPDSLPGRGGSAEDEAPRPRQGNNSSVDTNSETGQEEKPVKDNRCRLSDVQEGNIGKLMIHKSGRIRLALGDTLFEVAAGTQASFRQELVSMAVDEASKSANLIALGALPHKLNLIPHWESLLSDLTL